MKGHAIVKNKNGVLFLMKKDDFRFGTDEYQTMTDVKSTKESITAPNGRRCKVYRSPTGYSYMVFSDWSAKLM